MDTNMLVNEDSENSKEKRKHGAEFNADASPSKMSKIGVAASQYGEHSQNSTQSHGGSSQSSNQSNGESSQSSTQPNGESSQKRTQSLGESSQNSTQSHEKQEVLKLDPKRVFTRLLVVFSQDNLPDKITYDGQGYNLTAAYDDFWEAFYSSPYYSEGHGIKIPKVKNLIDLELNSLLKILKRGWEDERYWPKKLASPFVQSCLFGEVNNNSITPEMFLEFIEPSDKAVIQNQSNIDQNVLNIFRKYCSEETVSEGDDIKDSLIKAAHKIMVINMKQVIDCWSKELTGIMPMSTFVFLMGPSPNPELPLLVSSPRKWMPKEDDMEGYVAPHKLWNTFFLNWPEDKVKYYFHLLANGLFDSKCNLCGDSCFNAKHFISACQATDIDTLRSKRHHAILTKLLVQVNLAIERRGPYFGKGSDWKLLTYFENVLYVWPAELSFLESAKKYPHIVVYSTSPVKRAIIIEHSISWEHWIDLQNKKKTEEYLVVKTLLEKGEFEVEYRVVVLGSRGVLVPDLYNLFKQIFGMEHSEISKALEDISQEIIDIPYQSKYYKKLMKK